MEDDIKMDVREEGYDNRRWMQLVQDRVRRWASVFGVACSGSATAVRFDPYIFREGLFCHTEVFEKTRTVGLAYMRQKLLYCAHCRAGRSVSVYVYVRLVVSASATMQCSLPYSCPLF